jgi:hypothetical protein
MFVSFYQKVGEINIFAFSKIFLERNGSEYSKVKAYDNKVFNLNKLFRIPPPPPLQANIDKASTFNTGKDLKRGKDVARDARHKDRTTFLFLRRGTIRSSKIMLKICALYFYTYRKMKMEGGGGQESLCRLACAVLK